MVIFFSSFLCFVLFFFKPWIDGTENKLVTRTRMLATASLNLIQGHWTTVLILSYCQDKLGGFREVPWKKPVETQPSITDLFTSRETTHHHQSTRNIPDHWWRNCNPLSSDLHHTMEKLPLLYLGLFLALWCLKYMFGCCFLWKYTLFYSEISHDISSTYWVKSTKQRYRQQTKWRL